VEIEKEKPAAANFDPVPEEKTTSTNVAATNAVAETNVVQTNLQEQAAAVVTNAVAAADTNAAVTTNPPPTVAEKEAEASANEVPTALGGRGSTEGTGKKKGGGGVGLWSAIFILSLIGLGILIALDVSHYFGNKALQVIYNDEGKGVANPEYEAAEQVWANGKHLEAIRMMREYLDKHPKEQHVALRIAEIYEKDLGNHLAAALEYEEVLKHKLPAERWGWAAIHLCNLYFKLDQEGKALELLRKLAKDYPNTAAAEKARKRLEQMGEGGQEPMTVEEETTSKVRVAEAPAQPESNLPPGFRKKK
jgi:TolA-binding protein